MKVSVKIMSVMAIGFGSTAAFASGTIATATAQAQMNVTQSIAIENDRNLVFNEATQGAAPESILPSDNESARFIVTGIENSMFSIILPSDGDIVMKNNGGGSIDSEIEVNGFNSNFAGNVGQISGPTELTVGATRAQLSTTQVTGSYEETFAVTVQYQ